MTFSDALILISAVGVIIIGFKSERFYYAKGHLPSKKRAPIWFGRIMLIGGGTIMLLIVLSRVIASE